MSTPPTPSESPMTPEPMSPAQTRARRAQRRAFVEQEQSAGRLPISAAPSGPAAAATPSVAPRARVARQPAGKRFHVHEVARLPVEVTPAARAVIDASSDQGRLLPQALSEALADHPGVTHVTIDALPKSRHFSVHPAELHPLTGAEPLLLRIEVAHTSGDAALAHHWLINAAALSDIHPETRRPRFGAEKAAREFLRLYRDHTRRVEAERQTARQAEQPATPPAAATRTVKTAGKAGKR